MNGPPMKLACAPAPRFRASGVSEDAAVERIDDGPRLRTFGQIQVSSHQ